jgi:hypothetical protein
MERFLTAALAGLWTGTLAGIGVAAWIAAHPSQNHGQVTFAEKGMGEGLAMLGGGILAGLMVCAAVALLTYFVFTAQLRLVQTASATAILGMAIWGAIVYFQKPPEKFAAYIGVLDVEVRIPKSQRNDVVIAMGQWIPPQPFARKFHDDGDVRVLETSMTVPYRHDWTVTVASAGKGQIWYKLGWEEHPTAAIPWTDWIAPSESQWRGGEGITVRCRWRLAPSYILRA